jgi:DNA-binding SARP family transcriptional activator/tetratricopeptide (TPR) repeat protein
MAVASPQQSPASTSIRLCGPFGLVVHGRDVAGEVPRGQPTSLLCYLLAAPDRTADRDELIAVLWPEQPPRDPSGALRPILSRVRRALAPGSIEGRERLKLVLPEPVWLDLDEATANVEVARTAAQDGRWDDVREQSDAALTLLRPGLLPGLDGDWLDARRRELDDLTLEALEWHARGALESRTPDVGAAERAGRELIARSPYRETGYRFLMESLARNGNAAEALRVYDDLRVLLRDELGTAPASEIQELHGRLLAGDVVAARASGQPAAPCVPLPALLSPREQSAFIGREQELGALRESWERTRSGERHLVFVAGEPGIGKTRLTREFAREAHGDGPVLHGACQEGAPFSYQPFVDALRHYARESERDWSDLSLGPGGEELARLIPELGTERTAEPAPVDPETRRYMLFEAVSLLLADAAARAPVLLVLDDLHWADRATLQLLRHVVRAPVEVSLLIVGTYRPADIESSHPLTELLAELRRDRLFERVSLRGLERDDVGELIAAHAGHDASAGVVGAVHEQTDGNPFYIEEVLRHLIETGVLVERDGSWASALKPEEIGVPEGVKEVLESRLARLSDNCRSVLSEAAILGREFSFEVLAAMADAGEDAALAALEEAIGAQLVLEQSERPESSHAFTHALVRETLYSGLSAPRRQRLHARAAAAIEDTQGEDALALLASHYRLAGASGDVDKAIDYSLRAGGQAAFLSAWEEAAAHWEGAIAVMERAGGRDSERAQLLVTVAELMLVIGDLDQRIAYLERALQLYEKLADAEHAAQTHSRLGMAHSLIGEIGAEHLDIGVAFGHFDAARPQLEDGPVRRARGHLETGVSTALTYGLQIPAGMEAARRGMEIGETIGDDGVWTGAAQAYAWHKIVAGELEEGFAIAERSFEVADREQRPFLAFMGANIRAQWTWGLGAPDEAQAFFERPLRLPYVGQTLYQQESADGIGRCHLDRGEIDDARRLFENSRAVWFTHSLRPLLDLWEGNWDALGTLAVDVLATSSRSGNRWDESAAHHFTGRICFGRGAVQAAIESLEKGVAIVVDGGARFLEVWVRRDLARARTASGDARGARDDVDRLLELVGNGEDWRGRVGHVALAEAIVLAAEDRPDEAIAAFDRAHAIFQRYRLVPDQADALHEWGRMLRRAGERQASDEKLDAALELFSRHGAGQPWLERVMADRRS